MIPLDFEQPWWLLLLLLIIPTFGLALRSIGGQSRAKATITFALRTIIIVLLAIALAHPTWVKRGEGVTVTVLLDRSQSVPLELKRSSLEFLRLAANARESKRPEDRVSTIVIARDAHITALPDSYSRVTVGQDVADATATNLAEGVRTALATMPDDTANRIVIASDGNETLGSVMEAAELATSNGVPIDVVLLEYEHPNEVIFDRIVAPARARVGQSINVKLLLRAQQRTVGAVHLTLNGEPVDLNGDGPGDALPVELDPGVNAFNVPLSIDDSIPHQFDASFIPADPASDEIDRNNAAVAVTFVGGEGRVLVVSNEGPDADNLVRALEESDVEVHRQNPAALVSLIFLTGFDAVVLMNVPRYDFSDEQDAMLHAYVHDFGGGLVMVGGPDSLGAGGWIDSQVARVLPVNLDPPQQRQMPRGALALIMHSCEMAQGNFWGQKVAESAINALSRLDYCGILEYGWGGGVGAGGASWVYPLQIVGDKVAAVAATKQMQMGDMPDFGASMQAALTGLQAINAGQKHVIIISDGDPAPPTTALLNSYIAAKITVTTIMVGGHGTPLDANRMQAVAQATGGRYYNITNPKQLPQIFIKEAEFVSRSLIQEGDLFAARVASRLPGPTEAFAEVPPIEGYVLTAQREGLAQTPIVIPTKEANDPLYATWNYGLGRSIAYTSDLTGRWGAAWLSWAQFREFWEQSIRWVMRPSSPRNMQVTTSQDGDLAVVEVEALGEDASFINFLNMRAGVHRPDGETAMLPLQQVGPGRYRGEFPTDDAGAYMVNINYRNADGSEQGHLQAAVMVPYSDEFRAVKHNAALLRDLAEQTKGRVMSADVALAESADLFNRTELEVPKTAKRIWDLLAILAASLFIFDVAARRLAVDTIWLKGAFARAIGRKSAATEDTVAAWKRTQAQLAKQRKGPGERKKEREEVVATTRFEAGAQDAGTAFSLEDELAGREQTAQRKRAPQKPGAAQPGAEPQADEESYTSRLMAAKRRARQEEEQNEKNKDKDIDAGDARGSSGDRNG